MTEAEQNEQALVQLAELQDRLDKVAAKYESIERLVGKENAAELYARAALKQREKAN